MRAKGVAALTFGMIGLMMFFSGGMLAMFLGLEYAMTQLMIGTAFLVIGGISLAIPAKSQQTPALAFAAPRIRIETSSVAPIGLPTKVACPDCGASPSHLVPGLNTCEYCGASFVVPGL